MSKKETMQPFDPSKGRKNREVKATTVAKMVKQRIGPIELGTDNPEDIIATYNYELSFIPNIIGNLKI